RQQIICSRSFGERIYDLDNLQESVSNHITRAAEKLRQQDSLAGAVSVFIQTSPFLEPASRYQKSVTMPLSEATADSRLLARTALQTLRKIYRPGFAYQKAGVMLSDIYSCQQQQGSLFSTCDSLKNNASDKRLMQTLDHINSRWGRGTLRLASEGTKGEWQMKRDHLSPAYTTEWDGLPVVKAR
ncbi:MAG: DUF4113 domain-containing protein, partial [Betaproteobacteria bacterium]